MLKDTSMRNCKANYLTDRNLLYEKAKKVETKLPPIEADPHFNPEQYFQNLRNNHSKAKDMKENDPKQLEIKKKQVAKKKSMEATMSQYGGKPLISDLETKYQSNMDVTSEMEGLS